MATKYNGSDFHCTVSLSCVRTKNETYYLRLDGQFVVTQYVDNMYTLICLLSKAINSNIFYLSIDSKGFPRNVRNKFANEVICSLWRNSNRLLYMILH